MSPRQPLIAWFGWLALLATPLLLCSLLVAVGTRDDLTDAQLVQQFQAGLRASSEQQQRLITITRHMLTQLAEALPPYRKVNPGACVALFASIWRDTDSYTNIGLVSKDGLLLCSGLPHSQANYQDRPWFNQVMATGAPVTSNYLVGRISYKVGAPLAVPWRGPDGQLSGAVFAALSLETLSSLWTTPGLQPAGSRLTFLDAKGQVLQVIPTQAEVPRPLPSVSAIRENLVRDYRRTLASPPGMRRFVGQVERTAPAAPVYVLLDVPERAWWVRYQWWIAGGLLGIWLIALALLRTRLREGQAPDCPGGSRNPLRPCCGYDVLPLDSQSTISGDLG